jgi:hypothetical protein
VSRADNAVLGSYGVPGHYRGLYTGTFALVSAWLVEKRSFTLWSTLYLVLPVQSTDIPRRIPVRLTPFVVVRINPQCFPPQVVNDVCRPERDSHNTAMITLN